MHCELYVPLPVKVMHFLNLKLSLWVHPFISLGPKQTAGAPRPAATPGFAGGATDWESHSSVQSLSPVQLFANPWTAARQASLSITNSQSVLKPMSIESVMPSNHLIFCCCLLLPSIFPSIRVFSIKSALHIRWPKSWSFSFSISPSNEYSRLISFRIDWFDLLAVQGTLKSLLQYHRAKGSILQCSAFFIVQLSHPYRTTGKTTALTRPNFVGKGGWGNISQVPKPLSIAWKLKYFFRTTIYILLINTFAFPIWSNFRWE